jgi:hypothetical protein
MEQQKKEDPELLEQCGLGAQQTAFCSFISIFVATDNGSSGFSYDRINHLKESTTDEFGKKQWKVPGTGCKQKIKVSISE